MAHYYLFHCFLLFTTVLGSVVQLEEHVVATVSPLQDEVTTVAVVSVTEQEATQPSTDVPPSAATGHGTTTTIASGMYTAEAMRSTLTTENATVVEVAGLSEVQENQTETTSPHGSSSVMNNHLERDYSSQANNSPHEQHQQHQVERPQQHLHLCSSGSTCADPNSHCVGTDEGNRCVCFLGFFLNETSGVCERELETTTTTTTTTTLASINVEVSVMTANKRSDDHESIVTTTEHTSQPSSTEVTHVKRKYAMAASNFSADQSQAVVSLILRPYTTVVEWLMEKDQIFRTAISDIIANTNFTVHGENGTSVDIAPNITADDVIYVSPSPQIFADGLLVSFVVQDKSGASTKENLRKNGLIIRNRRNPEDQAPTTEQSPKEHTGFFPAQWIIPAICANQTQLETQLGQNVSALYAGLSSDLLSIERLASASLFERRIDVFVPVIILLAVICIACVLSVVCVRAKARSSATWDPPAGLVYTRPNSRKDDRNSMARCESGHDLASDAQCREGETDSISKQVIPISDDDVWVVPYTEPQPSKPQIWTQVQDTKL